MARFLGVLAIVVVLYVVLMGSFENTFSVHNHRVLAQRLGFYGVLTLGAGLLIVAGGIDLSIGSLVGLAAVCFGLLLDRGVPVVAALGAVVAGTAVIGLFHGLLITGLKMQPFLVTLCGLFMYRGLARWVTNDTTVGLPHQRDDVAFWRELLFSGNTLGVPNQFLLMLLIAGLLAVLLHASVYGRYMQAIGYNKQAARYSGITTERYEILAYVLCSTLAGLGGVLFLFDIRSASPSSAGSLLELYAITGAVLGGCSLRGGEGNIPGMLLGTAVLPLLNQICINSSYIGSTLEYTVIGAALLVGTVGNELLARRSATRKE